jgi:hypothetical protein
MRTVDLMICTLFDPFFKLIFSFDPYSCARGAQFSPSETHDSTRFTNLERRCMTTVMKDLEYRVEKMGQAWGNLCPLKSFSGLNLERFNEIVKPSMDARKQLRELEVRRQALLSQRRAADVITSATLQRIVHAVKGDPEAGEDSDLYSAMGFVPKSQRGTGLTRRRAKETEGKS